MAGAFHRATAKLGNLWEFSGNSHKSDKNGVGQGNISKFPCRAVPAVRFHHGGIYLVGVRLKPSGDVKP